VALFLISYDLRKKSERDYKTLYALLKRWKAKEVLESVWKLRVTDSSCEAIGSGLAKQIHKDDGLIVIEVKDWAELNPLMTLEGN